ncbi:MAG: hypothetical protein J0M02_08885 [Planctomycetes bacterium]|nr:hypothetical protein [Planctomycetota bacterium]
MRTAAAIVLASVLGAGSAAAADAALPTGAGRIAIPEGWSCESGTALVLRGPGGNDTAPRLAVTIAEADPAAAAQALRDGYVRITDGCEILDEDEVPMGGRIWRRTRVRFATGPVLFGQSAWIGSVGGRTVVAVLSAPDERLAAALSAAVAALSGISAQR